MKREYVILFFGLFIICSRRLGGDFTIFCLSYALLIIYCKFASIVFSFHFVQLKVVFIKMLRVIQNLFSFTSRFISLEIE